jgi:hypothetical protein
VLENGSLDDRIRIDATVHCVTNASAWVARGLDTYAYWRREEGSSSELFPHFGLIGPIGLTLNPPQRRPVGEPTYVNILEGSECLTSTDCTQA